MLLTAYLAFAARVGTRMMLRRKRMANFTDPGRIGLPFEELRLTTADGLRIAAWYIPAARPTGRGIVHVNGHGGNRSWWVANEMVAWLHDDYDQLVPDLRACGDSEGDCITFGWTEHQDVLAAFEELTRRGNDVLGVQGNSMGAATAIKAAALRPDIRAVWADATYATVYQACLSAALYHAVPFPRLAVRAILARACVEVGADLTLTEPLAMLPQLAGRPVYFVHGAADPYVDPDNSRVLFLAAPTADKALWLVPRAGHGNAVEFATAEYRQRLLAFFGRTLARENKLETKLPNGGIM